MYVYFQFLHKQKFNNLSPQISVTESLLGSCTEAFISP